jgi:uncharacterized iron-regulated protein
MPSRAPFSRASLAFAALLLAACAGAPRPLPPALQHRVALLDGEEAQPVDWEHMLHHLAEQEVVYFGETHDDQVTHALELAVLEELHARTGGAVVLALEMFERDQQAVLDDYVQGRIEEGAFYAATRTWGNYRAGYRPLIEFCRAQRLPVIAANAPAAARRKVTSGGLEALTPEERPLVAEKLYPNSDAYWARFDEVMSSHGGGGEKPTAEQRLRNGQCIWDNTMGESVVRALEAHPGSVVLLVVGRFHVEQGQGTAEQVEQRRPGTRAMTLIAEPLEALERADPHAARGLGTWVAFVERRARIRADDEHVLRLDGELRYSLSLPKGTTQPLPWLVCLPREGERSADAKARLGAELGDAAAFLVVEGPLPYERADLARGAAWTHPSYREEQRERLVAALAGALRELPRAYPLDEQRLVLCGEGEGRVLAEALAKELPRAHLLSAEEARDPRAALGLAPRASTGELLLLLEEPAAPLARPWAEIYAAARGADRQRAQRVIVHADLAALPAGSIVQPLHFAGPSYAEALRQIAPELEVREAFQPSDLANGKALPLAAGAFGGTTVLYVPGSVSDEQRAAWMALETEKAIGKRSQFARLAVCFEAGSPTLAEALAALVEGGKKSALVVPAVWAADAAAMQALRAAVGEAGAKLELTWLPGLGAEMSRARD